jgi:hypothetical protein
MFPDVDPVSIADANAQIRARYDHAQFYEPTNANGQPIRTFDDLIANSGIVRQ